VLVSNFNDKTNAQGTGTTIVQVSPGGAVSQFAGITDPACPGGVGLTTALVALRSGWVIVGSLPTQNGAVSGAGCLIVLDSHGAVRETLTGHGLNGPWDMTALDLGGITELFVTNVLNGLAGSTGPVNQGTVLRLVITSGPFGVPHLLAATRIGSGFPETLDKNALVIGPTGVGLGRNGTLYVADTLSNRIAAIPNAVFRHTDDGLGRTVSVGGGLKGELGLAIAPNGDVLTVNGNDGNIVEVTPGGAQTVKTLIPNGAGDLFGLAVKPDAEAVYFVNDLDNTLNLFH
jgi:DNA-binding beta-propeller fold protein YncE